MKDLMFWGMFFACLLISANKEWMKRKVRDLDKEIEEYEQKSITDC